MYPPKRIEPGPGQESVWDYPRPPRIEAVATRIRVEFGGETIADSVATYRILETSHPPTYYIPMDDVLMRAFRPNGRRSICEWKGQASFFDVVVGDRTAVAAAWSYPAPVAAFANLKDFVAFFAHAMDACYVNDERVLAQEGDFYGGWITSTIVGPFKGPSGTRSW